MKQDKDHIHKLKKQKFKSGYEIYKCILPGCRYFINSILVVGNFTLCWRCEQPFVLKNDNFAKPHCDNCTNRKKETKKGSVDVDQLTNLLT